MLSGTDQLAACVSCAVSTFLQAIAVCFLSEQGREQVGKGTIGCVRHTQVFKIWLWACSVLTVPGCQAQVTFSQQLPVSLRQGVPTQACLRS